MKKHLTVIAAAALLLGLSALNVCAGSTSTISIAKEHQQVTGIPNCSECHSDSWAALNHQAPGFLANHRHYAQQQRQVCNSCHRESFCVDCHAHQEEIKPSDKYAGSPERALPHRGDYLFQHRIDGKVDPASCARCHGRQNNERCKTCHR